MRGRKNCAAWYAWKGQELDTCRRGVLLRGSQGMYKYALVSILVVAITWNAHPLSAASINVIPHVDHAYPLVVAFTWNAYPLSAAGINFIPAVPPELACSSLLARVWCPT